MILHVKLKFVSIPANAFVISKASLLLFNSITEPS